MAAADPALLDAPLSSGAKMVPDRFSQRIQAGPGEPPNEALVDVGEPGVGEMVAQVIQVRPGTVGAYQLRGVGGRLVADSHSQPVQDPSR
jgi:hypothetical protein